MARGLSADMTDVRSLLIVDDDAPFRERLVRAMRDRGYEATGAADHPTAMDVAREESPELALVDLRLPGESGLAVVRDLKELDPSTVVVVLTGYGSIATAVESIKLGAASYLTKPADADQIVAAFDGHAAIGRCASPLAGASRMGAYSTSSCGLRRQRVASRSHSRDSPAVASAQTCETPDHSLSRLHPGRERILIVIGLTAGLNRNGALLSSSWWSPTANGWSPQQARPDLDVVGGSALVLLLGLAMVGPMFAQTGWANVTFTGGEVRNPGRS